MAGKGIILTGREGDVCPRWPIRRLEGGSLMVDRVTIDHSLQKYRCRTYLVVITEVKRVDRLPFD
jgi:hypothetical protein